MSIHSFNSEVAEEVGLEAAIIFQNIQFWIEKNQANQDNIKDGKVWVYNSRAAWCELFPYMGEKQIRNAVEALVTAGWVERGNYSYGPMNRTYWYCLGEKAKLFGPNGQTKVGRKGQTKTVVETVSKQTVPPTPQGDDGFEDVWKACWTRGKASNPKQPALKAYQKAIKAGATKEAILAAVKKRVGVDKADTEYAPQLSTWLNQRRWEDVQQRQKPSDDVWGPNYNPLGNISWEG